MSQATSFFYKGQDVHFTHFDEKDYIYGFHKRGLFFEQALLEKSLDFVGENTDSIIIDAGANVGNHAVFWGILNRARAVLSIEANPKIFQALCDNIELNGLKDTIKPISAILGSTDGLACQSHFNGNGNAGGSIVEFGWGAEFSCTVDTIYKDYGDMRRVSLLKIDCEGVDFEVLKGARNLLETFKPIVMVEVFPTDIALQRGIRTQLGDYFLFLHELGYKLVWNDAAFNYIFKHS